MIGALLLLFNGHDHDVVFHLPAGTWQLELDSTVPRGQRDWTGSAEFTLCSRSVALLAQVEPAAQT